MINSGLFADASNFELRFVKNYDDAGDNAREWKVAHDLAGPDVGPRQDGSPPADSLLPYRHSLMTPSATKRSQGSWKQPGGFGGIQLVAGVRWSFRGKDAESPNAFLNWGD